jgi:hypothetical protein
MIMHIISEYLEFIGLMPDIVTTKQGHKRKAYKCMFVKSNMRRKKIYKTLTGHLNYIEHAVEQIRGSLTSPRETRKYFEDIVEHGMEIDQTIRHYNNETGPKDTPLLKKILRHEFGLPINALSGMAQMYTDTSTANRSDLLDFLEHATPSVHVLRRLFNLFNMGTLSRKDITRNSSNINLEKLAQEEILSIEPLLRQNNQGIYFSIATETPIYTSPEVLSSLLSLHHGDSAKWGLPYKIISHQIKEGNDSLSFSWENTYDSQPTIAHIGLNEGIGTEFTEEIVRTLGGKIEVYSSREIEAEPNGKFYGNIDALFPEKPIFGKKITIPMASLREPTA